MQQTFNTGDPIKRVQPLFVRVPSDGIQGESREVWVPAAQDGQLSGRWHKRTKELFPRDSQKYVVLRGSQRRYHGIIGVADEGIVGGGDEIWEQAISYLKKKRFTFGRWEMG